MKRGFKAWVCTLGATAFAVGAYAAINPGAVSDTPYSIISVRNVFDLRERIITDPSTNAVAPALNVKLTGLTTLFGYKQAVFTVTEQGKPQPITIVLAEGERQNGVEVVSIDMQEKTANIKNDERPAFLRLDEKAGGAVGGGTAVAGVTAPNPALGGRGVAPGMHPAVQGGGSPYGTAHTALPNAGAASPFNPQGMAQPLPNTYGMGGNPDQFANPYGVPTNPTPPRQVRTDNVPALTPEQQAILIETQRASNPTLAPILPPTKFSSDLQSELQNSSQPSSGPPGLPTSTGPAFIQPHGTGSLSGAGAPQLPGGR